MKGLELAKRYYEEIGRPALLERCPELETYLAAGLVGEGSECLGYDDELSRDHDWGPGFCLWLSDEAMQHYGREARKVYESLPKTWLGYTRLRENDMSAGRVGVMGIEEFFFRFLGRTAPPEKLTDWLTIPEHALCACTNGMVFEDRLGRFTAIRQALESYYPEDVRRKKLAARCALAAQSGQYNFPRCLKRNDRLAAMRALGEFVDHSQAVVFLLARRYRPYYKWAGRAMGELPLGAELEPLFNSLTDGVLEEHIQAVEEICARLIAAMQAEGLTGGTDDFLLPHAMNVQETIEDSTIRSLPLLLL